MMIFTLASGVAGAQTLKTENGELRISTCYGTLDGVQCDALYYLTKKQSLDVTFYSSSFTATLPNGDQASPTVSSGGKTSFGSFTDFKAQFNAPVKVSLLFNVPNATPSLRTLALDNERVENVPIRASASAIPTPAPVASAPAPAQTINIAGNWSATLTNCKQASAGVVVCTATLRK